MNITPFTIYLITRADHLKEFLFNFVNFAMFVGIAGAVVVLISLATEDLGGIKKFSDLSKKLFKWWAWIIVPMMFLNFFIPTTKEIAAIIIIPVIANNQETRGLGEEIPKLAREWLEELKPSKVLEKKGTKE